MAFVMPLPGKSPFPTTDLERMVAAVPVSAAAALRAQGLLLCAADGESGG